jgi:GTP pyrophosphokinase
MNARAAAVAAHDAFEQKRSDGKPYWTHPERVVATLASYGQPAEVLAAAWLHDVPEDCSKSEADCREMLARFVVEYGAEVAALVTEVTNYFDPAAVAPMEEKQARLREHASSMSAAAKWIKLADRWDNISGMEAWSSEKRRRYATSTQLLLEALRPLPSGSETLAEKIAAAAAARLQAGC